TTDSFLEKLGLETVDDLPPIAEFIPDADVVEALEHGLRVTPEIEISIGAPDRDTSDGEPLDDSTDDFAPTAPAAGAGEPDDSTPQAGDAHEIAETSDD
ncbi:MAG: hypothetical protein AB8G26_13165, partial [Ilumatobacter sp.]